MLGVVVWADPVKSKAIVWCEDHGDLAYIAMSQQTAADITGFYEGDLIQFDLQEHEDLRLAQNPRRIAQHFCSDIDQVIATAQKIGAEASSKPCSAAQEGTENVVELAQWRAQHRSETVVCARA